MKKILIPKEFKNRIEEMIKEHSVIYLYAQIGWGKTNVVSEYLNREKIVFSSISAGKSDFSAQLRKLKGRIIVLDDFQDILPENGEYLKENFYELLREHRFIILSRSYMPSWLKPYQIIGQLGILDREVLHIKVKEIKDFLEMHQI